MRIGLIQTRGIGDIVIALPIAQYFIEQGHEVHWPVDGRFHPYLQAADRRVHFHPINLPQWALETFPYFYQAPYTLLKELDCDRIHCLYSYLPGVDFIDQKLARSLKFDEYKYALCGVPFTQKWRLRLERDRIREQALFDSLAIKEPFTVIHTAGPKQFWENIKVPGDFATGTFVYLKEKTDNPFDWLTILERAAALILSDSLYANLVEQLNLPNKKALFLRSDVGFTPVLKNGWTFL